MAMKPKVKRFVPDDYVPISCYAEWDGTQSDVEIKVRSEILTFLIEHRSPIKAAVWNDDQDQSVFYTDRLDIDQVNGLIRIKSKGAGRYVIVTEALRHSFPIVTNWNARLHEGRGGPESGGTDGIGLLRLNAETGAPETDLSELRDTDPTVPYLYRTDAYALFAGEEAGTDERTTSYERYIGEWYSLVHVTEDVAIKLSDDMLELTGYPVILRAPGAESEQMEGVPAYQLVHGVIAGQGEHRSMVSYLLPPFWTCSEETRYPALFSGFYDQNENVFMNVGPPLLKVLGQSFLETGKGAVGIIWNGGGSFGTRTLQGSVYENLDDLFRIAVERYAVDGNSVVTVGGSRGGITSLLAAGNPNSSCYSVRYAVCYNVPFSFGEPLKDMVNPTCPVYSRAICEDIGFKDAWKPGWTDPEGRTAVERFHFTLLGTTDSGLIASELGPASDRILQSLRASGTQVWLTQGTHDAFTSTWLAVEWANRARWSGIQVRHEIGYRFGHNNCTNPFESAKLCLNALLTGEPLELEGTWHYRRVSEAAEQWELAELFEPAHPPVFLEGPKVAVAGLPILFNLYGEPGMDYRLVLLPTSGLHREPILLMEGTMEPMAGYPSSFSFVKSVQSVSERFAPGVYEYALEIRRADSTNWERPAWHAPHPGFAGRPSLEVTEELPNFSSDEWLARTTKHAIGWGLSEV